MKGFSYWELQSWFTGVDFCIIGSGIVGLNCALSLREQHPKATILVLDKGILPKGASTKNAGFSCFGSISELIADLERQSEQEVLDLVRQRWEGVQLLRRRLRDDMIQYQQHGGYEVFFDQDSFQQSLEALPEVNKLLQEVFNAKPFQVYANSFGFANCASHYIGSSFEGQLHTGAMMQQLIQACHLQGIQIIYGMECLSFTELQQGVQIHTPEGDFNASQLFIATNGFASKLISDDIKPARAQIMITKPIEQLSIKGVFHMDQGYYYFRNIDDRILIGGARNLDFKTEETTQFNTTETITNQLQKVLSEVVLPSTPFELEHQWSGIMGVGNQKGPIIKVLSDHVFCGVRLGGMGVAIGSAVGAQLAALAN